MAPTTIEPVTKKPRRPHPQYAPVHPYAAMLALGCLTRDATFV